MSKLIIFITFISISLAANAQQNRKNGQWLIGGDFGYSGGNNSSYFGISPEVSYLYKTGLEVGGSIGYSRISVQNATRNIYTIGPLISYSIGESFFARSRYLFLRGTTSGASDNTSFHESSLWIGGGYIDRLENGGMLRVGVMYNALYNENKSVYSSPILPFASFSFGL